MEDRAKDTFNSYSGVNKLIILSIFYSIKNLYLSNKFIGTSSSNENVPKDHKNAEN
jgi:hypothetical protein